MRKFYKWMQALVKGLCITIIINWLIPIINDAVDFFLVCVHSYF